MILHKRYIALVNRLGLTRRAGSVLQDEPEPLSSRLDLRSSRGKSMKLCYTLIRRVYFVIFPN